MPSIKKNVGIGSQSGLEAPNMISGTPTTIRIDQTNANMKRVRMD